MEKSLSLLLSLLLLSLLLPLSGCGSNSLSVQIPEDTSKELTLSPAKLNVDWDKAVKDALYSCEQLLTSDSDYLFWSIQDAQVHIDDTSIVFDITLYDLDSINYIDSICLFMRTLNEAAMLQDKRIPSYGEFSMGGIYDVFETTIAAYTSDNKTDPDSWYINDVLAPGEHRKRLPQPLDGSHAIPFHLLCSQLSSIFNTDSYPYLTEDLDPSVYSEAVNIKNSSDSIEINFLIYTEGLVSQKEFSSFCKTVLKTTSQLANRWNSQFKAPNGSYYGDFLKDYAVFFFAIADDIIALAESLPGEDFVLDFHTKDDKIGNQ